MAAAQMERQVFEGHPAAFYSIGQVIPFVAGATAAVIVAAAMSSGKGWFLAFLLLTVWFAAVWAYYATRSRGVKYVITTQRIRIEFGLLSKVQENLELFRIDHFELRKPIGMRLLGYASLHLFSSDAELARFAIRAIPNLEQIAETLRECQLRERTRRGLTTFVKA